MADQTAPSSLDQSPVLLQRDPRISLLFALLGALIAICVLFLVMGGNELLGGTRTYLLLRATLLFMLMFMCFAAAGWTPVSTVFRPILDKLTFSGGK